MSDPLRVLHLLPSLAVGGAEKHTMALAATLIKDGLECDIAVMGPPVSGVGAVPSYRGVRVIQLGSHRYDPRGWAQLRRLARDYDVVHAHLFPAIWLVSLVVSRPKVLTEHSPDNGRRTNAAIAYIDRRLYRRFSRLIAISDGVAVSLRNHVRTNGPLVTRIYNGLISAMPATEADPLAEPFEIVSVGALDDRKDMALVIRAVALVPGAKLTIIGDGPQRRELVELAENLGGQVELIGRADVSAHLAKSHIFVSGSRYEGFGIAALEALSAGVPVLAPDIPGLREVVEDPACLYPPGDELSLRALVVGLMADRQLLSNMREEARTRAGKFPLANTARSHARLYREVAQGTRAHG